MSVIVNILLKMYYILTHDNNILNAYRDVLLDRPRKHLSLKARLTL